VSNLLRKLARAQERAATKQLTKQVFIWRELWDTFSAQVTKDGFDGTAENALHALMANYLQGRREAKSKDRGLVEIAGRMPGDVEGELTRRLKEETK